MRVWALMVSTLLASGCAMGGHEAGRINVRSASSIEAAPGSAYELAKRQLALGNFGLAIDYFRKAVRENPQSADALNGLAVSYDRIGRFDLSRRAYEEALALAPTDTAIMRNFGTSLKAQGLHAQAAALEVEMGKPASSLIAELPPPAVANAPEEQQPSRRAMRIQRVSTHEVALVANVKRPAWELVSADNHQAKAEPVAKASGMQPYLVSAKGSVSVPLPEASKSTANTIVVLNGVGRRGLARQMSGYLRDKGWEKSIVGDSRARPKGSLLVHAPKDKLNALLLARTLPFQSRLVVSEKARRMILLLGRNATIMTPPSQTSVAS